MSRAVLLSLAISCALARANGETLADVLTSAHVPAGLFSAAELDQKITSYAVSNDNPFLLAYYLEHGNILEPPLRLIRFDRVSRHLQRLDIPEVTAAFQGTIPMGCLGSALHIREHSGFVYLDTHINPSAGCLLILSSSLVLRTAISGWLLGVVGSDYAIARESEIHFNAVHPLHLDVLNLKTYQISQIYPYPGDGQRAQFTDSLRRVITRRWCMEANAPCDPDNFSADLVGGVIVNESARTFGFVAQFDAEGFCPDPMKVPVKRVGYIFREVNGSWKHHQFVGAELDRLLEGRRLEELILRSPERAFAELVQ